MASHRSTAGPASTVSHRPSRGRQRAGSGRGTLVGFLLLFALIGAWAFSTPLYAAPDEPAHAVRAAGAGDGQIVGRADPAVGASTSTFSVPGSLSGLFGDQAPCFAFASRTNASCEVTPVSVSGRIREPSYVGRYPPLYYALVGLPSAMFPSSPLQLYYMRLVSAALSALFLAAALVSGTQVRGRRWVVVGVVAAITPTEIFLAGVINPSGLEISSALCLWVSGLALADAPEPRYRRRLVVWTALSAGVLVQNRGLSPLFLGVIVVTLAVLAGRRRLADLLRRREMQVAVAIVAVVAVWAVIWIFAQRVLVSSTVPVPLKAGTRGGPVARAIRRDLNLHQMIGIFGWLDTRPPPWCYRLWEAALVALVALGVLRRRWRALGIGIGLGVVVAVLPVFVSVHENARFGLNGQARYIIPLGVGLPVIAAYAASPSRPSLVPRLVAVAVGFVAALVQVTSFLFMLRRYRTGIQGPLFTLHAPWQPQLPWLAGVIGVIAVELGFLLWWLLQLRGTPKGPPLQRPPSRVPVSV